MRKSIISSMPISVIATRNNWIINLLQVDLGFSTHIYLDLNAEIRDNTITRSNKNRRGKNKGVFNKQNIIRVQGKLSDTK